MTPRKIADMPKNSLRTKHFPTDKLDWPQSLIKVIVPRSLSLLSSLKIRMREPLLFVRSLSKRFSIKKKRSHLISLIRFKSLLLLQIFRKLSNLTYISFIWGKSTVIACTAMRSLKMKELSQINVDPLIFVILEISQEHGLTKSNGRHPNYSKTSMWRVPGRDWKEVQKKLNLLTTTSF